MTPGQGEGAWRVRSVGIDAVRILSLAAIVAGHVWATGRVVPWLYTWHVPLFFIITGYLWSDRRTFRAEAAQRGRRLLIPYLCWLAILLVAIEVHAMLAQHHPELRSAAAAVWGGEHAKRPFTTFWFVTALFFAVLLLKALRRFSLTVQAGAAVLGLVVGYVAGRWLAGSPLAIGLALPCLFYLFAGIILRDLGPRLRRPIAVGVALVAVPAVAVALRIDGPMDLKAGNMGPVGIGAVCAVMFSYGLLLVGKSAMRALRGGSAVGSFILSVASSALVLVLLHPVVLWVLNTPGRGRGADFALALLLPSALGVALVRTPLAPYLVGVNRAVRHRAARGRRIPVQAPPDRA